MRPSRLVFFAAATAAALSVAGCSSDEKSSSPTTPTTAAAVATTLSDNPYCQTLQRLNERYGRINPGFGEPEQLRTALEDAAASVEEAQANAPAEVQADLATLNAGLQQLLAMFEGVNFDITKLSASDLDQLQSAPELDAARQRVEVYTRDNCL